MRQIPEAIHYVHLALKYRADHLHSLHLLALLLTAQKQLDEALVLVSSLVLYTGQAQLPRDTELKLCPGACIGAGVPFPLLALFQLQSPWVTVRD